MKRFSTELSFELDPMKSLRIDEELNEVVSKSGINKGSIDVEANRDDVIISTIEFEPGLAYTDFPKHYIRITNTKSDIVNKFKHKLVSNKMSFPINLGKLVIGDWQQIFLFSKDGGSVKLKITIEESPNVLGLESVYPYRELDHFDITDIINGGVNGTVNGYVTLITPDSTAIITTIKPEEINEFKDALELIAPKNTFYAHQMMWHDHNGHSHIRASMFGQSVKLPIKNGKLDLKEGERLILIETNINPLRRDIYFMVVPEEDS